MVIALHDDILEILETPALFVTCSLDVVLAKVTKSGGDIWLMIGTDDKERYYLVFETSENSRDEYPEETETLNDLFSKLLEEAIRTPLYD